MAAASSHMCACASLRCWIEPCFAESASCTACRFLPYVGMVTIIMNDYPMLKYGLIAVLAILVITSKE